MTGNMKTFFLILSCLVVQTCCFRYSYYNYIYQFWQDTIDEHVDPEVNMNATQLITSKGYPCEDYEVHTADGFILGLQRIPHGRGKQSKSKNQTRPVVFLQHGLLCSSTNWLTNLVDESFAYILADAGYDVWLGNVRGNTYSRKHEKYTPSQEEFWAFSWDEMAKYDIPAMIDFALHKSGQPKLHYIGHSQGTLILFAQLAQNPKFAEKIITFYALGPVATVKHIESPLKYLAHITPELKDLFAILGVKEFLPNSQIFKILGSTVCRYFTRVLCENILFLIAGYDSVNLNNTRLPVYIAHTPAGTSVQDIVHFAQMIRSGKFQMFDFGSAENNVRHYGYDTPPVYNFSNILAPVALYSAQNDWLADPLDVSVLSVSLPNIIHQEEIPSWDHLDFIWATDAPTVIYRKIIQKMKERP